MAIFTTGAFAAKRAETSNLLTVGNKEKIAAVVDKLATEKSLIKTTSVDAEQGYILIKLEFSRTNCPNSFYKVAFVLTIKIWDDGGIEFYPWEQNPDLICS